MPELVIDKDKIELWVNGLIEEFEVMARIREEKVVLYRAIKSAGEIDWTSLNSVKPPKDLIYPQTQELFRLKKEEKEIVEPEAASKKKVVFGIRLCDVRAFSLFDALFEADYPDVYYLNARQNTSLVALICASPGISCFCPSMGIDFANPQGAELFLTDLGDKYFVDVETKKGNVLVEPFSSFFREAEEEDKKRKWDKLQEINQKFVYPVEPEKAAANLPDLWESPYWERVGRKCVACGICTYLCPTCYCFDIQDEDLLLECQRFRCWDSCQYPEFTLQASGENPRPTKKERWRQRFYHKFNYFPARFSKLACVGCGRCVDFCPVNIDIREIITDIARVKTE